MSAYVGTSVMKVADERTKPGKAMTRRTTKTAEAVPTKRRASRYVQAMPIDVMTSSNAVNAHACPPDSQRNGCTSASWPTNAVVCPAMSTRPVSNRPLAACV